MSKLNQPVIVSRHDAGQGTARSYSTGFGLSVILTFIAYGGVERYLHYQAFSHLFVMAAIVCLAVGQLFVQLVCFLHLGRESKPRWNLTLLFFALMVVVVIVAGSMWIMYNLNYRMTPQQVQKYLNSQDGF